MGTTGVKYLMLFALSSGLSLALVPGVIRIAEKLDIVDRPKHDRWHRREVPKLGGVAIFAAFMLTSAFFGSLQRQTLIVFLGAFVIFITGVLDDKFGTYPKTKFSIQLGVALLLVSLGVRLNILPIYIAIPLTLVWIVGITNAFNLIDNMDGLSAGVAFIASITFFLFFWKSGQMQLAILSLALAGSCLGFLVYNFSPARIFMGDCGSLFIGYTLSAIVILGFWQKASPRLPLLVAPILVLGYAVFDTTFVTILRLKAGGRPWIGGKDHSSHRLVRLGLNERSMALVIYALGVIGSFLGYIVLRTSLVIGFSLLAFICMAAVVFGWILATKGNTVHQ